MSTFGNIVKKMLIDKGISQRELARKMSISENNLSNILNRNNIKLETMQAIATALNCELKIELVPKDGGNVSEDVGAAEDIGKD